MLKLKGYLRPFIVSITAIIALLWVQAACDLSLPGYTSNIVNIGIQQGGIENGVPKAIRKSEFDRLILFMNEEDKAEVSKSYTILDKSSISQNDYDHYTKIYPRLSEEPIYTLNANSKNEISRLNLIMSKPILAAEALEKMGISLSNIPPAQIESMKNSAGERFAGMPDSMITQGATSYIRKEYKILGMDTDKIQTSYILRSGAIMLLIALLSMGVTVAVGYFGSKVGAGLSMNLRKDVFGKVISFSSSEFDKFSTASLITRTTNDIQQIQMLTVMLLRIVFYAPILGIGGVIKVFKSDYSMAWIIGVAVAAILILVAAMFYIAIPKFKAVQKLVDRLNLVTREILTGILVIRAFNTQKHEEKKFDIASRDLTKTNLFINRVMSLMMPAMMLIMNGVTLLIVWVGARQIDQGAMQVGNMMAFIQYTMQIIMAFLMISMVSIMLPRAAVSAERIEEILSSEILVRDVEKPQNFGKNRRGHVEFRDMSFRYPGAEVDALSHISFTAEPGQTTAFIGSTGSGKTTLINLIPRFYDVTGGQILIDGVDISKVPQHELRARIGYVPQKALLFSGTIESNLKYSNEAASEEELVKAADIAQASEFIKAKPEGLKADISQGGSNVSGGQKQRLSIARALVKKPDIYIFDDSFSALDFKTDALLREALKRETAHSTLLIVAQRISTIINADRIIVLDEGKIAGIGSHKELMKECEVYRQIALSQLSMEELA